MTEDKQEQRNFYVKPKKPWPWQRWWREHTIQRLDFDAEAELIAHTRIRFDWIGRILILFGRDVEVEITTKADVTAADAVCEGFRAQARHVPRRWRL